MSRECRQPLSGSELLSCDDLTLLDRSELELLVMMLREDLAVLKAERDANDRAETLQGGGDIIEQWKERIRKTLFCDANLCFEEAQREPKPPVCSSCNDTHWVDTERGLVMCARCPVPCEKCRNGAFCDKTPCACECHSGKAAR